MKFGRAKEMDHEHRYINMRSIPNTSDYSRFIILNAEPK
jgi:hypothetical protein